MGKDAGEAQQQQQPPDGAGGGGAGGGAGGSSRARRFCCCGRGGAPKVVRLQCVAALVLGVAVLLSALFWLPPFAGRGGDKEGPDPADEFGGAIVASFRLHKTVPELTGNKSQLELDIYEEVGIPNSTVVVNTLHPLDESNWTNIIFNIVPFPENVTISSASLSILRSKFMSLVVRQSTIHLTEPLFGNSSAFEVIKFPGGITIIPPQTAFLLQRPHATFNFTLNYPIYKLQDRTNELKDQMKAGLLLNPYENLYIKLTNSQGSTILPPTIVETSIVLEVGNQNHEPSVPRMKQLARTITNSSSSSGNLGLNHTVFGRVKQISLSSYLRHSLHSGGGSDAPSPAPMHHHGHHGHHHHHHSHDDNRHPAPAPALAPIHFPMPQPRYGAPPPSGCPYSKNKPKKRGPVTPAAEPAANDHLSPSIALPPHPSSPSPASRSRHGPSMRGGSPVPPPPALPEPPLPTVSFAHPHPPSERGTGISPAPSEEATRADPAEMSQVAPAPHSSYATRMQGDVPCRWVLFVLVLFTLTSLLR